MAAMYKLGHGFTDRAHQIDVMKRVRSWFTHWLGDSAIG